MSDLKATACRCNELDFNVKGTFVWRFACQCRNSEFCQYIGLLTLWQIGFDQKAVDKIDKLNSCLDDLKHLFACDPLLERSLLALFATSCDRLKSVIGMKIFPWDAVLANTLYHIYQTNLRNAPPGLHQVLQEFSNVLRNSLHDDSNISWISKSSNFETVIALALELTEVLLDRNCSHNEHEDALSIVLSLLSINPDPSSPLTQAHWSRLFKALDKAVYRYKSSIHGDVPRSLYFINALSKLASFNIPAQEVENKWKSQISSILTKFLFEQNPVHEDWTILKLGLKIAIFGA
ncbi:hypothetical protein CAPTEDRAFT_185663 [Capitella teleta]|uniref:Uncharacterized protein n=1 Tax=Capitella teleta TaxID=283909 RepID=R7VCH6_CAPTE|nr:hypothetical protein CAPTEDRAFT_185663 [Capitella teleta]|eukprot:ELU16543.1 hypothetical protein CAPTEDRAFT_185663 [Capitella teleta]